MNVKLKNRDIEGGLALIASFVVLRGLPIKVSFAIGKTCRRLKEVTEVAAEERQKLVKEHQATDSDGKRIELKDGKGIKLENPEDFADAIRELGKQETDVDVHRLAFKNLIGMKDSEGKKIIPSPSELEGLMLLQIISEDADEEEDKDKEED